MLGTEEGSQPASAIAAKDLGYEPVFTGYTGGMAQDTNTLPAQLHWHLH